MKKSFLFIYLFVVLIYKSNGNGIVSEIDNDEKIKRLQLLKTSVNKTGLGEVDVLKLIEIQNIYESINIDSALVYAEKEVNVASQTGNQNLLAEAKIRKAKLLRKARRYKEARDLLLTNLDELLAINDILKGKTLRVLAGINARSGNFVKATDDVLKAIALFSCENDSTNLLSSYHFLARIYDGLGDKEKAKEYSQIASQFDAQVNKRLTIRLLIDRSIRLIDEGKFEAALSKTQKAQAIADSFNFSLLKINVQVQYAHLYYAWQNNEKLLQHALKADDLLKAHPVATPYLQNKTYKYLAEGYVAQKKYTKAKHYLDLIDRKDIYEIIDVKSRLIRLYENINDYKLAHLTNKELYAIKDSINQQQQKVQIKEVLEKYENNKKQLQIQELKHEAAFQELKLDSQAKIFYTSMGILFLLLISSFIFYKGRIGRQRLKEISLNLEKITLQHRFLRTQLNPHFLFHALSSIELYVLKGEKEKAVNFLQDFSGLIRTVLETSNIEFITLRKELLFIEKYLQLQQLNHGYTFRYSLITDESIDDEELMVPPMILQPLVENAILHGALPSKGFVDITVNKNLENLFIQIVNSGYKPPKTLNTSKKLHRSMSTEIMRQRIDNIEETHGLKITYAKSYQSDDTLNSNTSVRLTFPIIRKNYVHPAE